MRFGDIVLLLLMTLMGFGFLLSHSINLYDELTQSRSQLARMQAELQMLQAQHQSLIQEKDRLTEQLSGLTGENNFLKSQVETLESERLVLTGQIEKLRRNLALVEAANPILAWLVSSPAGRVAALIVLPIVPLSLGTAYVMTHKKATNLPAAPTSGNPQRRTTFQAALTREEFHLIALRRRSRAASKQMRSLGDTLPR